MPRDREERRHHDSDGRSGRSGDDSGRLNRSRCRYDRDNEDNDERDRRRHSRSYNDNERDEKRRRSRSSRSRSRSRSQSRSLSPHSNERKDTSKPIDTKVSGIQLKLITPASVGASPKPTLVSTSKPSSAPALVSNKPAAKLKVASIFADDDDDEPEEMPPECRMRMKNVGRETPTSAGPNSFGKTKIGFCNVSHINEKKRST